MSQLPADGSRRDEFFLPPRESFTILSIFGTRPEIVKFAPVLQELERRPEFRAINVCTSQHTDLAAPFLQEFNLRIDHDLNVMRPGQALNRLLSRILDGLEDVLETEQPDFVLVQGDTTSALAGAISAFHRQIPVGHIEAGLRSGNPNSPFPEEMNRVLIDQMATSFYAATERNRETLIGAGANADQVFVTGNPVVDALLQVAGGDRNSPAADEIIAKTAKTKPIVLTAHRRENFGGRMAGYFTVLADFLREHDDVSLIFPVHPNPNVRTFTEQHFEGVDRVHLIDPMPYPEFVRLLSHAWLIVSDSGGVQEEAPTLKKPLLIIRENTERPEAIECGTARLIGEEPEKLAHHLHDVYADDAWRTSVQQAKNPFGDGKAAQRIADAILAHFSTLQSAA